MVMRPFTFFFFFVLFFFFGFGFGFGGGVGVGLCSSIEKKNQVAFAGLSHSSPLAIQRARRRSS
jgi:hypothetical protein